MPALNFRCSLSNFPARLHRGRCHLHLTRLSQADGRSPSPAGGGRVSNRNPPGTQLQLPPKASAWGAVCWPSRSPSPPSLPKSPCPFLPSACPPCPGPEDPELLSSLFQARQSLVSENLPPCFSPHGEADGRWRLQPPLKGGGPPPTAPPSLDSSFLRHE